ncbi:MAG TPA: ABC transporter permease [Thermodesulfobacteriota bacterium]|nr:ABC transporter permease [Thermodesulfobacteriota bacterium]
MSRVWSVAHNTFIEAVRDRVLYSLILFAFLMILSSLILASISGEQYNKIVKDLGFTVISLIGVMISVFLGMGLVYKEIEKKTVYNIFSKPIHRYEFVFGKYLGLAFTLLVNTAAMAVILFLLVLYTELRHGDFIKFYYGGPYYAEFFKAVYFIYLEFLIIIGVALVFSSFTTPVMTVLFTFLVIAIGRFSSDVKLFAEQVKNPVTGFFTEVIYRVMPNLEKFDVRREAVYGGNVSWELILNTTAYALLYTLALLLLSIIIFQKREFK